MFIALLGLLLLAAPSGAAPEKVSRVIARVIAAYGGQSALDAAHAVRQTGHIISPTRGTATLLRAFERPDHLRVEVAFPGSEKEVRLLDGSRAMRNGETVMGPPRDAMLLQAARLDLPALLSEGKARARDLGEVQRGGVGLRALEVPLGAGLKLTVLVAPDGRVLRSEGSAPAGPMGVIHFDADYSDFRVVKGVLYAFTEQNFANGQATGQTRLDRVEVLAHLPAESRKP